MRFNSRENEYNERGYLYRTKKFFALFPVLLDGELRWLETVEVRQVWTEVGASGFGYNKEYIWGWETLNFLN